MCINVFPAAYQLIFQTRTSLLVIATHYHLHVLYNSSQALVYATVTGMSHCVLQAMLQRHTCDAVNREHTCLTL